MRQKVNRVCCFEYTSKGCGNTIQLLPKNIIIDKAMTIMITLKDVAKISLMDELVKKRSIYIMSHVVLLTYKLLFDICTYSWVCSCVFSCSVPMVLIIRFIDDTKKDK